MSFYMYYNKFLKLNDVLVTVTLTVTKNVE